MPSALVGCLSLLPSQRQQVAGTVRPPPQPLPSNGTEPCDAINHGYKLHCCVNRHTLINLSSVGNHTNSHHNTLITIMNQILECKCVFFLDSSVQSGYLSTTGTESMISPFFRVMVPVFRSLGTRRPFWPSPSLRQCPCPNVLPRARAFCFMPCRPNQKSITCGVARPRSCSPHCVKTEKTVLLTIINVPSLVHRPPTGPHSLGGPPGDC
ncbi:hypothetical protein EDB80DRAFT_432949 [Ilyonectria destructans]|nr:hypothetical protein EDB80DRAFT_432949 [Ilyonectria destructans]